MNGTTSVRRRLAVIGGLAVLTVLLGLLSPAQAQVTGIITGKIINANAEPIVGAQAVLCPVNDGVPGIRKAAIGTSGDHGNFRFRRVPEGEYALILRDPLSSGEYPTRYYRSLWYGADEPGAGSNCLESKPDQVTAFTVSAGQTTQLGSSTMREGAGWAGRHWTPTGTPCGS